jgi:hypothetical protein
MLSAHELGLAFVRHRSLREERDLWLPVDEDDPKKGLRPPKDEYEIFKGKWKLAVLTRDEGVGFGIAYLLRNIQTRDFKHILESLNADPDLTEVEKNIKLKGMFRTFESMPGLLSDQIEMANPAAIDYVMAYYARATPGLPPPSTKGLYLIGFVLSYVRHMAKRESVFTEAVADGCMIRVITDRLPDLTDEKRAELKNVIDTAIDQESRVDALIESQEWVLGMSNKRPKWMAKIPPLTTGLIDAVRNLVRTDQVFMINVWHQLQTGKLDEVKEDTGEPVVAAAPAAIEVKHEYVGPTAATQPTSNETKTAWSKVTNWMKSWITPDDSTAATPAAKDPVPIELETKDPVSLKTSEPAARKPTANDRATEKPNQQAAVKPTRADALAATRTIQEAIMGSKYDLAIGLARPILDAILRPNEKGMSLDSYAANHRDHAKHVVELAKGTSRDTKYYVAWSILLAWLARQEQHNNVDKKGGLQALYPGQTTLGRWERLLWVFMSDDEPVAGMKNKLVWNDMDVLKAALVNTPKEHSSTDAWIQLKVLTTQIIHDAKLDEPNQKFLLGSIHSFIKNVVVDDPKEVRPLDKSTMFIQNAAKEELKQLSSAPKELVQSSGRSRLQGPKRSGVRVKPIQVTTPKKNKQGKPRLTVQDRIKITQGNDGKQRVSSISGMRRGRREVKSCGVYQL